MKKPKGAKKFKAFCLFFNFLCCFQEFLKSFQLPPEQKINFFKPFKILSQVKKPHFNFNLKHFMQNILGGIQFHDIFSPRR
jgi:hypothetical protein